MGWDGIGCDGMRWDGMRWDGMGWDGMGWGGMGWDGMGRDGMGMGWGWDGMGRRHERRDESMRWNETLKLFPSDMHSFTPALRAWGYKARFALPSVPLPARV